MIVDIVAEQLHRLYEDLQNIDVDLNTNADILHDYINEEIAEDQREEAHKFIAVQKLMMRSLAGYMQESVEYMEQIFTKYIKYRGREKALDQSMFDLVLYDDELIRENIERKIAKSPEFYQLAMQFDQYWSKYQRKALLMCEDFNWIGENQHIRLKLAAFFNILVDSDGIALFKIAYGEEHAGWEILFKKH